jgi:hypothetical protein
MSSLGSKENDAEANILIAIANDDAETVAKLATDKLKSEIIKVERTPDPMYTMTSLGMLSMNGETYKGLKLEEGQTLLDIAQSNQRKAAIGALLSANT